MNRRIGAEGREDTIVGKPRYELPAQKTPKKGEKTLVGRPKYQVDQSEKKRREPEIMNLEEVAQEEISPLVYTAMEEMVNMAEDTKEKVAAGELSPEEAANLVFGELNKKSAELKKMEGTKIRGWHPAIKGAMENPNPLYTLWGDLKQQVKDQEKEVKKAAQTESEEKEMEAVREKISKPAGKTPKRRITRTTKTGKVLAGSTPITRYRMERPATRKPGLTPEDEGGERTAELVHSILAADYPQIKITKQGNVKSGFFGRNKRAFDKLYNSDSTFKSLFDEMHARLRSEKSGTPLEDEEFMLTQAEQIKNWNEMNPSERAETETILGLYQAEGADRVRAYMDENADDLSKRVTDYFADLLKEKEGRPPETEKKDEDEDTDLPLAA